MLKGINPILTGDLLKVLSDMGQGDTIVVADGNFAASTLSTNRQMVRAPSQDTVEVLEAVLEVFPLEDTPGALRYMVEEVSHIDADDPQGPPYPRQALLTGPAIAKANLHSLVTKPLGREDFYRAAEEAFAIVATTDRRLYFCYILTKGALPDPTALPVDPLADA